MSVTFELSIEIVLEPTTGPKIKVWEALHFTVNRIMPLRHFPSVPLAVLLHIIWYWRLSSDSLTAIILEPMEPCHFNVKSEVFIYILTQKLICQWMNAICRANDGPCRGMLFPLYLKSRFLLKRTPLHASNELLYFSLEYTPYTKNVPP